MRRAVALGLKLAVSVSSAPVDVSDAAWSKWCQAHHRVYATQVEEALRRSAWETYSYEVALRQDRNPYATFVVDGFADFTPEEHAGMRGGGIENTTAWHVQSQPLAADNVMRLEDTSIDWRTGGLVTPVKDQSSCGTCWSFSSTGMQEAAWAQAGHPLTPLSEQKMIDCGCGSGPYGIPVKGDCDGGLPSEADYPYVGPPNQCGKSDHCHAAAITSNMESTECLQNCNPNDQSCGTTAEPQILQWLQNGPVGVSVEASFGGYKSGIITDCDHRSLNHAVLIVGFGEESGQKYWIFKNSWGTGFGEAGYWRMQYGVNCLGFCGGGPCRAHAGAAPSPPSPGPAPTCGFIGEAKDFLGANVKESTYSGNSDEEKDASCCAQCESEPQCEFWVRATDMNGCWLKRAFSQFSPASNRRGNFVKHGSETVTV